MGRSLSISTSTGTNRSSLHSLHRAVSASNLNDRRHAKGPPPLLTRSLDSSVPDNSPGSKSAPCQVTAASRGVARPAPELCSRTDGGRTAAHRSSPRATQASVCNRLEVLKHSHRRRVAPPQHLEALLRRRHLLLCRPHHLGSELEIGRQPRNLSVRRAWQPPLALPVAPLKQETLSVVVASQP